MEPQSRHNLYKPKLRRDRGKVNLDEIIKENPSHELEQIVFMPKRIRIFGQPKINWV